jgi:hypothetical protein
MSCLKWDATAMCAPVWLTNNFGYGPRRQSPAGQIGDGRGAGWTSSLRGVDPMNPTQPTAPQKASGPLGIVSNQPIRIGRFHRRSSKRARARLDRRFSRS